MTGDAHAADVSFRKNGTYRPELDGLRFFAFLLVFVKHGGLLQDIAELLRPISSLARDFALAAHDVCGYGVALFFVLSSYLLTTLLKLEYEATTRIDVMAFWVRRSLRIWPLYFTYLAGLKFVDFTAALLPFALFGGNWEIAFHGYPSGAYSHLWSISVEEQFYLCWPFLVVAVCHRTIFAVLGLVLAWIFRAGLFFNTVGSPAYAEFSSVGFYCDTFVWVDCLALGALMAKLRPVAWSRWQRWLLTAAGLACWELVGLCYYRTTATALNVVVGYFLVALGGAAILAAAVGSAGVLRHPILVHLGRISYGLYVFHILSLRTVLATGWPHWAINATGLLLTIAVGVLSYRVLELPFLALKSRFQRVPSSTLVLMPNGNSDSGR